jgi:predicted flavoprotein YhiN
VVTADGIEGSLVYAHASALRDTLAGEGRAGLVVDLVPGRTPERLEQDLARQDRKASFTNRMRKGAGIEGVKLALLREFTPQTEFTDAAKLAHRAKSLTIPVTRPRPIAEAISSAGGIRFDDLDENYMLRALPGAFAAGEMLDWEAPTGGYLLTACFATGRAAAKGILSWLERRDMQQR